MPHVCAPVGDGAHGAHAARGAHSARRATLLVLSAKAWARAQLSDLRRSARVPRHLRRPTASCTHNTLHRTCSHGNYSYTNYTYNINISKYSTLYITEYISESALDHTHTVWTYSYYCKIMVSKNTVKYFSKIRSINFVHSSSFH